MKRMGTLLWGHCVFVVAAAAACGGDPAPESPDAAIEPDAETEPDAAPVLDACGATVGTLVGPDDTYSGTLALADGADFNVEMGECANEVSFYTEVGPDAVVAVTGLTAGTDYTATVTSATGDLAIYVASSCDAMGPAAGACLGFTDRAGVGVPDVALFEAPADGVAYLIIDVFGDQLLGDGAYTVTIGTPECVTPADCGDGTCVDYACVDCVTSYDCDATAPVCEPGGCGAGPAACTGDDAGDTAPSDDGPSGATVLTVPTGTATAAICSAGTPREEDWYTFTTTAEGSWLISATWSGATDIDFQIVTATGGPVASGTGTAAGVESVATPVIPAGTYFVQLYQYAPPGTAAATAYTLTLGTPECSTSFDCTTAGEPVCAGGACVAGSDMCVGDDLADTTGDDDGPAGATLLTSGVPAVASVCNVPVAESDYFAIDVAQSGSLTVSLDWAGSPDLSVVVHDNAGAVVGGSLYVKPEVVTLTYLPAGRYYVEVWRTTPSSTAVDPYTVTATVTAGAACSTSADCASTHSTQSFRGTCTAGACVSIPAGMRAAGAACDTGDDCTSTACSYVLFEADAAESVCTTTCTTTTDCASLGADFRCSQGLLAVCMPSCATNLDCGANTGSSLIDSGQPWDYGTCDAGTGVCMY